MKVLITGASGYLGSHLVELLLSYGCEVIAVDNLRYNQTSLGIYCANPNFKLYVQDCCDPSIMSLAYGCDFIIPLAALVGAPICTHNPDEAIRVNIGGVKLAIETAKAMGAGLIIPNTNSGYGTTGSEPCTEDTPLKPISVYGSTKLKAEIMALEFGGISFRFATLFGTSLRMRTDLLVNDFCLRAVRDKTVTLFEPHFRRNYLHVRDAARAFLWAMQHYNTMKGRAYNVGLPDANLTKRELAERIKTYVPELAIFESTTASDPDKRDYLINNSRILATGWRPTYSLDDGIQELIKAAPMYLKSPWSNA